jgi:demethylmenaquinone methyltransferase/2-methoxy-6-polyprenyl-1,4-benzoquinol methylase
MPLPRGSQLCDVSIDKLGRVVNSSQMANPQSPIPNPQLGERLPSGQEKAAVVRAMFDRIAPRYDVLNRLFSFRLDQRWRRETIRSLALSSHDIVLDIACGTGDLSELAARSGAVVTGVDFAGNMLVGARRRAIRAAFVQADAGCLPFHDGWASAVVSGFALRNFVSLPAVFAEMARVLAPEGRLALLEVDSPRHAILRWGHHVYFNRIVPVLGGLLSDAWAYSYLPRSVAYLPEPVVLQAMLETAGFHAVARRQLSGGIAQLITAVR